MSAINSDESLRARGVDQQMSEGSVRSLLLFCSPPAEAREGSVGVGKGEGEGGAYRFATLAAEETSVAVATFEDVAASGKDWGELETLLIVLSLVLGLVGVPNEC